MYCLVTENISLYLRLRIWVKGFTKEPKEMFGYDRCVQCLDCDEGVCVCVY